MNIFVLNGKWVIHWRWLLQCTLCTWCESGVWWPSLGCPQVFNRVKIWTHIWSRLYICITLLQEVFSLFRCVYTSPIMLDIWIWCWGQKVAQEKVEEHCQYIGQLLYHSLNLDQYVETQWGQVEQSNAMLLGPPKEPLFSYNIEIAFSLLALNSLLVWKTCIRNLRWYSATCHADNSVEL